MNDLLIQVKPAPREPDIGFLTHLILAGLGLLALGTWVGVLYQDTVGSMVVLLGLICFAVSLSLRSGLLREYRRDLLLHRIAVIRDVQLEAVRRGMEVREFPDETNVLSPHFSLFLDATDPKSQVRVIQESRDTVRLKIARS